MPLHYETSVSEYGINVLKVSYDGYETIELDLTDLFKDLSHFQTLYDPINEYVAQLPDQHQKAIYDVFFDLYAGDYKNNFEDPQVLAKLETNIQEVSTILGYNNFKAWTRAQENRIIYPDNIIDDYVHDPDMNTTLEKTYVKREYTDLIALIMFIRALVPLYVDFYNRIKQVTPHYYYKIFMLFVRSDVANCPEVIKLKTYVDVNQQTLIGSSKNENIILFAGLADDDILDSLLSEVVFNKLLTIDFMNKKCNIVSFIFQTIKYKGNYTPSSGVTIRGKSVENNPAKEDISYFEDYRKTSNIPIGTVVEIQHALSDVNFLALQVGETNFNFPAYYYEVENIGRYMDFKLDKVQVYLLGWFMNKIINPRALYYIEYRKLVELMLFAKTVLIGHGFDYMAAVMSARKSPTTEYLGVVIKNTMNKSAVSRLSGNYKFTIEEEKQSVVEKTILEISKDISNTAWIAMGTPEQLSRISTVSGYIETPSNLNDIVLEYVEFVSS